MQQYRCLSCGAQFQSERRSVHRLEAKIWREHIWRRQTIEDLKETYGRGERTIRRILDRAEVSSAKKVEPQPVVAVFDATHIGERVLLTARAPTLKANLGWAWIERETKSEYAGLRVFVESKGFTLTGVVLDGRTGIPRVFEGLPVQICQFHQLQIVRRKLTLRPETAAGQELLRLTFTLAKSTEQEFAAGLKAWFKQYESFINERTYILGTNRWRYTHRRVRSAYLSLKRNLPYLFTYQKYPELKIPNTTNSLDGFWSRLKNLLAPHRGKSQERIEKMVTEILRNTD